MQSTAVQSQPAEHPDMKQKCCPEELTIISWNVNGLKLKLVDNDFLCYISKYDLLLFSNETCIS